MQPSWHQGLLKEWKVAIKHEIREQIDKKIQFYPAPGPVEVNRQVKEFLADNHGYGSRVTIDMVISYLRHNYTNWPRLQAKLQDWKVWSVREHHEVRDYVDDLVWKKFEQSIPWELG